VIDVAADVLQARVIRRPDLSSERGADLADQFVDALLETLTSSSTSRTVVDLSAAPPVMGPRTEAAFARLLAAHTKLSRPIGVVASANPTQRLQLQRLMREHAPRFGSIPD